VLLPAVPLRADRAGLAQPRPIGLGAVVLDRLIARTCRLEVRDLVRTAVRDESVALRNEVREEKRAFREEISKMVSGLGAAPPQPGPWYDTTLAANPGASSTPVPSPQSRISPPQSHVSPAVPCTDRKSSDFLYLPSATLPPVIHPRGDVGRLRGGSSAGCARWLSVPPVHVCTVQAGCRLPCRPADRVERYPLPCRGAAAEPNLSGRCWLRPALVVHADEAGQLKPVISLCASLMLCVTH